MWSQIPPYRWVLLQFWVQAYNSASDDQSEFLLKSWVKFRLIFYVQNFDKIMYMFFDQCNGIWIVYLSIYSSEAKFCDVNDDLWSVGNTSPDAIYTLVVSVPPWSIDVSLRSMHLGIWCHLQNWKLWQLNAIYDSLRLPDEKARKQSKQLLRPVIPSEVM